MSDDREAKIKTRSYHLWIEHGRPHGQDHEHWAEAERQILAEEKAGYKMLKIDEAKKTAKPKRGTVVPDKRPVAGPANQTTQPPPVHAAEEPARSKSSDKPGAAGAPAPANPQIDPEKSAEPKARKGAKAAGGKS